MLHHHSEKPDDDSGARPNKNLASASLFSIVGALESISQDIHVHHCGGARMQSTSLEPPLHLGSTHRRDLLPGACIVHSKQLAF
ncbi:hypothetical protein P7K49_008844 [Saguinus oedipus]|uniref:Uncharacterized protein n=1 Tax=Saguinus oedipus TaxID=9490 RepID=A0ABQ9W197_SAGOE|nr:hypothetical protein P7K49_008844 [Saguinus oedipus]